MLDAIEVSSKMEGTLDDATAELAKLAQLAGYLGGAVRRHGCRWKILAYCRDPGDFKNRECLPSGCRMVDVPEFLFPWLGIDPVKARSTQ